jgi:hypothetical protein
VALKRGRSKKRRGIEVTKVKVPARSMRIKMAVIACPCRGVLRSPFDAVCKLCRGVGDPEVSSGRMLERVYHNHVPALVCNLYRRHWPLQESDF